MKCKEALVLSGLMLALCPTSSADADETKYWRFRAKTFDAIASSSDQLNGEYEVTAAPDGKLLQSLLGGEQKLPVGESSAAELKRMFRAGQDEREYLRFPLEGKWSKTYSYSIPGVAKMLRKTVEYKVVGEEEVTTPAGTFRTIKIEGDARVPTPSGAVDQKWVYYFAQDIGVIVKFNYDSAVGEKGAKIDIELLKFSVSASK